MNITKRIYSLLIAAAICVPISVPVAAGLSAIVSVSGCSTSAQKATYRSSSIAHVSVKAAMRGWNDYVAAGKATQADEIKVRDAYRKYQAAQVAVVNVAQAYGKVGQIDPATQDKLQAAMDASGLALSELIGLLNTYGIKTQ